MKITMKTMRKKMVIANSIGEIDPALHGRTQNSDQIGANSGDVSRRDCWIHE